jgi:hypothetical protein
MFAPERVRFPIAVVVLLAAIVVFPRVIGKPLEPAAGPLAAAVMRPCASIVTFALV